ncbi:MAG: hypothetical protein WCP69_02100 [Bacteroidota bacterium]
MNIRYLNQINCQLFSVNFDDQCNTTKEKDAIIIKKSIYINRNKHFLEYSFEIPFDALISIEGETKIINTKITYSSLFDSYNLYTYLTFWQRLRLRYNFNNLWVQKSSNWMWIINVLVAMIAIIATLCKNKL